MSSSKFLLPRLLYNDLDLVGDLPYASMLYIVCSSTKGPRQFHTGSQPFLEIFFSIENLDLSVIYNDYI
jgi:hypothetical protein